MEEVHLMIFSWYGQRVGPNSMSSLTTSIIAIIVSNSLLKSVIPAWVSWILQFTWKMAISGRICTPNRQIPKVSSGMNHATRNTLRSIYLTVSSSDYGAYAREMTILNAIVMNSMNSFLVEDIMMTPFTQPDSRLSLRTVLTYSIHH